MASSPTTISEAATCLRSTEATRQSIGLAFLLGGLDSIYRYFASNQAPPLSSTEPHPVIVQIFKSGTAALITKLVQSPIQKVADEARGCLGQLLIIIEFCPFFFKPLLYLISSKKLIVSALNFTEKTPLATMLNLMKGLLYYCIGPDGLHKHQATFLSLNIINYFTRAVDKWITPHLRRVFTKEPLSSFIWVTWTDLLASLLLVATHQLQPSQPTPGEKGLMPTTEVSLKFMLDAAQFVSALHQMTVQSHLIPSISHVRLQPYLIRMFLVLCRYAQHGLDQDSRSDFIGDFADQILHTPGVLLLYGNPTMDILPLVAEMWMLFSVIYTDWGTELEESFWSRFMTPCLHLLTTDYNPDSISAFNNECLVLGVHDFKILIDSNGNQVQQRTTTELAKIDESGPETIPTNSESQESKEPKESAEPEHKSNESDLKHNKAEPNLEPSETASSTMLTSATTSPTPTSTPAPTSTALTVSPTPTPTLASKISEKLVTSFTSRSIRTLHPSATVPVFELMGLEVALFILFLKKVKYDQLPRYSAVMESLGKLLTKLSRDALQFDPHPPSRLCLFPLGCYPSVITEALVRLLWTVPGSRLPPYLDIFATHAVTPLARYLRVGDYLNKPDGPKGIDAIGPVLLAANDLFRGFAETTVDVANLKLMEAAGVFKKQGEELDTVKNALFDVMTFTQFETFSPALNESLLAVRAVYSTEESANGNQSAMFLLILQSFSRYRKGLEVGFAQALGIPGFDEDNPEDLILGQAPSTAGNKKESVLVIKLRAHIKKTLTNSAKVAEAKAQQAALHESPPKSKSKLVPKVQTQNQPQNQNQKSPTPSSSAPAPASTTTPTTPITTTTTNANTNTDANSIKEKDNGCDPYALHDSGSYDKESCGDSPAPNQSSSKLRRHIPLRERLLRRRQMEEAASLYSQNGGSSEQQNNAPQQGPDTLD